MPFFNFIKPKPLLSDGEQQQIVNSIKQAEKATSGEIRIFIESKCSYVSPVDRAAEIFASLKMEKTEDHNAVLVYVAIKDRQLALYADNGIYTALGKEYWGNKVSEILAHCRENNLVEGLCKAITHIGESLKEKFPYENEDRNELPDNIVFGK